MQEHLDIIYDILGFKFNKEREKILTNFNESFQVQACPGSGKTTLLVAKLMLLAQGVDFSKGNICILTHTNVAIDEIKNKIKKYNKPGYDNFISNVNRLFQYPNFVGTTQSFLDKYLGIPGYIQKYGRRPNFIGDEYIEESFLGVEYNINSNDLEVIPKKTYFIKTPSTKRKVMYVKRNIQIIFQGKLSYKEIDYFSLYYLNNTNNIQKLLQKRFKYIFIDEIQDTNGLHKEILNTLFKGGDNIIQGFGDYNQEILEDGSSGDFIIFGTDTPKKINDSMRLSPIIANNIKNICINPQELKGYGSIEIPIYFIIFDNDKINEVISNYIDTIKKHKLHEIEGDTFFKAVGYIHKDNGNEKLSVGSYWEDYNNGSIKKSKSTLFSYFQKIDKKEFKLKGFKIYKDSILDGLIHTFNQNKDNQIKQLNDKSFSKTSLIKYFKDNNLYDTFSLNILKWSKEINKGILDWNFVKEYILGLEINNKTVKDSKFLDNKYATPLSVSMIKKDNILNKDEIKVTFSTIHKVKGETHTSTLLLDTNFARYENNSRILEFWNKDNIFTTGGDKAKGLKVNYVGLTRATHLLCIAINRNHIKKEHNKILIELGKKKEIEILEIFNT